MGDLATLMYCNKRMLSWWREHMQQLETRVEEIAESIGDLGISGGGGSWPLSPPPGVHIPHSRHGSDSSTIRPQTEVFSTWTEIQVGAKKRATQAGGGDRLRRQTEEAPSRQSNCSKVADNRATSGKILR